MSEDAIDVTWGGTGRVREDGTVHLSFRRENGRPLRLAMQRDEAQRLAATLTHNLFDDYGRRVLEAMKDQSETSDGMPSVDGSRPDEGHVV